MDPESPHSDRRSPRDSPSGERPEQSATTRTPRVLVTAGPTHEAIDEVRYLGNRSSGRLGIEIALAAARRGWSATLLLGPVPESTEGLLDLPDLQADPDAPGSPGRLEVIRFTSARDLEELLAAHGLESQGSESDGPGVDLLVMAAAVADHRPARIHPGKMRREGGSITLELESVPDLVAEFAARRPDIAGRRRSPFIVAFALEPAASLERSARAKLQRKGVEAIVANPIDTLAADRIDATLILANGETRRPSAPGTSVPKAVFAAWLLEQAESLAAAARGESWRAGSS